MGKVITFQVCGIVLDALYHNSLKENRVDQKSIATLAKECSVSVNTIRAFRDILIKNKLMFVEGNARTQITLWNKSKSALNPAMQKFIYEQYVGNEKRKVKLKVDTTTKKSSRISLDSALQFLVKHGFTGTIRRQTNQYTTECIDLSLIKVEE